MRPAIRGPKLISQPPRPIPARASRAMILCAKCFQNFPAVRRARRRLLRQSHLGGCEMPQTEIAPAHEQRLQYQKSSPDRPDNRVGAIGTRTRGLPAAKMYSAPIGAEYSRFVDPTQLIFSPMPGSRPLHPQARPKS